MFDVSEQLANFYPSMQAPTPSPAPVSAADLVAGSATTSTVAPSTVRNESQQLLDKAREEGVSVAAAGDEVLGHAIYGDDAGEGSPVADYEPHGISSFFDHREVAARGIKDDGELAVLAEQRTALNDAFVAYSVGPVRVREIMGLAGQYLDQPRDAESLQQISDNTMSKLRAEYGSRTDAMLQAAQKVSADLARRVKGFDGILQAGLGSDLSYVKACINAAKKKGFI